VIAIKHHCSEYQKTKDEKRFEQLVNRANSVEHIDRYVYDEALALFLCAPQALYVVNKHVDFGPYRTTFELAETEVDEEHWSRRSVRERSQAAQATQTSGNEGSGSFASGSSGNAC